MCRAGGDWSRMFTQMIRAGRIGLMAMLAALASAPAIAQMTQVDPDAAIDGDLMQGAAPSAATTPPPMNYPVDQPPVIYPGDASPPATYPPYQAPPVSTAAAPPTVTIPPNGDTYHEDDLIGAA